jgi:hypothetical protein
MNRAVISGDIIAYTSLSDADKIKFEAETRELLKILKDKFSVYGRILKGDYIECYIPNPADSLRVALLIKSFIKSFSPETEGMKDPRITAFKTYGIRLAIGIGEINRFDPQKGIIDGEAIYFSGRIISDSRTTSDKERIVIKNTLFLKSKDEDLNEEFEPLLSLIDVLISEATAKQSQVLYLKLLGHSEESIAKQLKLFQSTINQRSTGLGWIAIEKAVLYFEKKMSHIN